MHDPDPYTADQPFDASRVRTVLCDLDGVVWLAHQAIPGAADAIAAIRASGRRVLFVTNNSMSRLADQEAALARVGVPAEGDVVTSGLAAAALLQPGERALVAAGPGVVEAIERRGAVPVPNDGSVEPLEVDAVVVGLHRDFDFARLARAAAALHGGARLIATNGDATFPTPRGPEPGGGSIVAAIATAGQQAPVVAGKPHRPMADLISSLLADDGEPFDPTTVVMVGDRPETDGLFAATLGCPFVLVRTGVLAPGAPVPPEVAVGLDVADLTALASALTAAAPAEG